MSDFYVIVFLVGVFYTVISLIINGISGSLHSNGDFGADIGGHHGHIDSGHVQADTSHAIHSADGSQVGNVDSQQGQSVGEGSGFSHSVIAWFSLVLNPIVAVSFLTVFGGMGILGESYFMWDGIITLICAAGSGVLVSTLLYNFVAKPIYRSENTSNVSREMLIGTAAEVSTDILTDSFGTITYTVNSLRFNAPSKHIEGKAVKQGQKVVICKIEDNIFYISEIPSM